MSIITNTHAYAFLGGLYIGGHTNIFSNLIITGLITYIIHPSFYTKDRFNTVKNYIWGKVSSIINLPVVDSSDSSTPLSGVNLLNTFPLSK